jgi:hypothetical protein
MGKIRTLIAATFLALLAGCLSESGSDTSPADASQGPAQTNSAPKISGAPPNAVKAGDNYSFTPSAWDPDGDALTFSIDNKPNWATFDSSTGRLSGQPLLGDIGTYRAISISVSDGKAATALPTFSVEVAQTALGSMTLSWTPPTENEDGSVLTDLAGYFIYYGESPGSYPNRVRIDNPSISTYVVENLLPRTYYIVATSFNASGIESRYSAEAIKTVNAM